MTTTPDLDTQRHSADDESTPPDAVAGDDVETLASDTSLEDSDDRRDDARAHRRWRRRSRKPRGTRGAWPRRVRRALAFVLLPVLAMVLALGVGALKWYDGRAHGEQTARIESVEVAREVAVAMLTYQPDTAEANLNAARDRMTGAFRDEYTKLIHDVVIPGAREKNITALATVPAAGAVSATADRAVVLVFINQTTTVGDEPPTSMASSVKVTLDNVGGRWLISAFEPV